MRILLIDHACCDPPHGRVHTLRDGLIAAGATAAVCGPSSASGLESSHPGFHGIHLHDVAAASRALLAAVREGAAEALLAAVAGVPARLLGLVRETARQMIAEAVDALDPEAIFVIHAGILTDLAIETGAPVVVHVAACDLAAAAARPSLRRLVGAALGSCGVVVAADDATAATLRESWLESDAIAEGRCEAWPLVADRADRVLDACRRAATRRGMSRR
jgi:hypothetical protein